MPSSDVRGQGGATPPAQEGFLLMLWRWRRLQAVIVAAVIGSALVYALVATSLYAATTTLLSPREEQSGNLVAGLIASGLAPTLGLPISSASPNRDMLIGVLKSRTAAEALVERFDLKTRYGVTVTEEAVRILKRMSRIDVGKEGVISLTVWDADGKVAADMANHWVERSDRLLLRYGTGEAGRQRVFITEQLARARVSLERAEEALRRFQERNRAIVLEEQTRGAIEAAARLKGEMIAAEVQLQVMQAFATVANPEVIALNRKIGELKRQLVATQYGDDRAQATPDFQVPFTKVPGIGLDLVRLTREVKIQETVVTLLTQQLEQSRLTEAKDIPIVQILDAAIPSERPDHPRLGWLFGIAGALGVVLAVGLSALLEQWTRLRALYRDVERADVVPPPAAGRS